MRKLLWVFLLGAIIFCFSIWFAMTEKVNSPSKNIQQVKIDKKPKKETQVLSKQSIVKNQIYNQLSRALPQKKLEKFLATLSQEGMLIIPSKTSVNGKLSKDFKHSVSKLLPEYFKILSQPHFSRYIDKIIIEAHTSSKWKNSHNKEDSFQKNKVLSNQQARAVENYLYDLMELNYLHQWMAVKLATVGRSSEDLVYINGQENPELSKRIQVRVLFK